MKTKRAISVVALALLGALVAAGAISAAAGQDPGRGRADAGHALAGTWLVTSNRPAPLPPLAILQTFTDDGSTIESPNEPSATRTPAYGSWKHIEGRLYASTVLSFRFDPATGTYLGRTKVDRTIELAPDGQTFRLVGRVTLFDVAGNVVGALRSVGTAERMRVDPIPERP
jgi:hypothetical protein